MYVENKSVMTSFLSIKYLSVFLYLSDTLEWIVLINKTRDTIGIRMLV